jgi:exopolysaccharide biosynthesis polyprenyl glycosylphosphotransferase
VIERRRQIQVVLQLIGDLLATVVAFYLAYWMRFVIEVQPVTKGMPPFEQYLLLLPVALILFPAVFYFQGLYHRRRMRSRFDEALRVVLAVMLATVLLTAGLTFYRPPDFTYSRLFLAIFAVADAVFVSVMRYAIVSALARIRRSGGNLQRVLVVGAGNLGRQVVERLNAHTEYGFTVVGFLDDDPGRQGCDFHGAPVLGTTQDLEQMVSEKGVDQVMIALPLAAHYRTVQLVRQAGKLLVDIKVVPDVLQYYVMRAGIEDLDGLPLINLTQIPLQGWNQIVKRAFDIAASALLLLATSWLFPIIAWLIKREDGGPVFFSQIRTGMDGRSFRLFKFRSMRVDAEGDGESRWTRTRDSRVTKIGELLRRTNLDELPQLYNVLRGDMSLVGPRPEQPKFVERFRSRYPTYNVRHRVRAGITGWAQVNGLRGDTSIRQRIVHDLYYIENWSFGLDMRILWRTFRLALHDARS